MFFLCIIQIWSLSTSSNAMSKSNFFTAIRFITMVQNGDMPISQGMPQTCVTTHNFFQTLHHIITLQRNWSALPTRNFPLRSSLMFSCRVSQFSIQCIYTIHCTPSCLNRHSILTNNKSFNHMFYWILFWSAEAAPQLPPAEAYVMSPQELEKYLSLFKTYDSDHDGYVLISSLFFPSDSVVQLPLFWKRDSSWHLSLIETVCYSSMDICFVRLYSLCALAICKPKNHFQSLWSLAWTPRWA